MSLPPNMKSASQQDNVPAHTHVVQFSENDASFMSEDYTRLSEQERIRAFTLLQQNQGNYAQGSQQMKNDYDCFQHFFSFPRRDKSHRTHLHSGKLHQ